MAEEQTQNNTPTMPPEEKERFDVSFGNGALKKLKELAKYLGVSDDGLGEVLIKGMKAIEFSKDYGDGKFSFEKDGKKITIDVKDL